MDQKITVVDRSCLCYGTYHIEEMDYSTPTNPRKSLKLWKHNPNTMILMKEWLSVLHIEGLVLNFFHHHFSSLFNPVVSNLKDFHL